MKKSNYFAFLIIVCILFGVSTVSASDGETVLNADDDYQINAQSSQDLSYGTICEEKLNLNSDNLNYASKGESANFTQLHEDIVSSGTTFNLSHGYSYDNDDYFSGDYEIGTLVINGNNNVIDGRNGDYCFRFAPSDDHCSLIINDLTFVNFPCSPLEFEDGDFTLNNVNFTNCTTTSENSLILTERGINLTLNGCNFYSNAVYEYLDAKGSRVMIYNSSFSGTDCCESAIEFNRGQLVVEDCSFENFNAKHGSIIKFKGDNFKIRNSKFRNSKANSTGGAILAKYFPLYEVDDNDSFVYFTSEDMIIDNCTFSNVSSASNGGAIHIDMDSGSSRVPQSLNVSNCNFTDCSSRFGGAISILGGSLNINGSRFENNHADFEGGAIYSSWCNVSIVGSVLSNNSAKQNAGALYFDKGRLTIAESNLISNKALKQSANAIFAYDVNVDFSNSTFDNGGVAVYADFAEDLKLENIQKNNDIFLLDNRNYIYSVESKAIMLNMTKNETVVDVLPSRFDARDWNWTTPGKIQGDNDDCWAFATVAAIETALGKSTGVLYNLSENYVQKLQLKYYNVGDLRISLTGFALSGLGYALSWYGVLPVDMEYDDRGMIADTDMDVERIHLQDAMFVYTGMNDTVDLLKRAILKYGAVAVQAYVTEPVEEVPSEGEDIAIMEHGTHFITLIGWDDNYYGKEDPQENFAWITKNSLGGFSDASYSNFPDIDYYAIVPQRVAIAYIFENDNDYHVNYQTDLTGLTGFDGNYTAYSNEFASKYDELIGAVGTYFNESGIEYSFDIFVNGTKVHAQSGVSEFAGFRTIVLDKYVPIKTGDQFKVVFKSNALPYQAFSRVHYRQGMSLASTNGNDWTDFASLNKTVCLKVYTLQDDDSSFTALAKAIDEAGEVLNLTHDYKFNVNIDSSMSSTDLRLIRINKSKFTINGNNHVIDGAGMGAIFCFGDEEGEIVINNLTFKNFNQTVLESDGNLTLRNVDFTGFINPNKKMIAPYYNLIVDNCSFYSNHCENIINALASNVTINNSRFSGNDNCGSAIKVNRWQLIIHNSVFENFTYQNGAMIDFKGHRFEFVNSSFINAYSNLSGGAVHAKYFPIGTSGFNPPYISTEAILIKDCTFVNLSCGNDGGAIYIDLDSGSRSIAKTINIVGSNFTDCRSKYGGAIAILGGTLNIDRSNFIDNSAGFEGGAIYSSWTDLNISRSHFKSNTGSKNAGAIYFDKGKFTICQSNFTANKALMNSSISANAIYAHDVDAYFSNSTFDNGGIAVYADFAGDSKVENIDKNDDIFLMDNHDYIFCVESKGIKINLTKNEIAVDKLPSRFDARDWGWTTPGKLQGDSFDCWAFATIASIETALGKSTGVLYNLSQNYVQKLQLKYYNVGDLRISVTGFSYSGLGYALSWYGVLPVDMVYDDRGLIADTDMNDERIHVQDAMFIYTGMNDTVELLKRAILKYGAVTVQYYVEKPRGEIPTEGEDIALADHDTHFISLIGWDDNYSEFDITGAWIAKDSGYGFNNVAYSNFSDIDYYAILPQRVAIAYIFENDKDYHVNYQTDLTGLTGFDANYTSYSNEFTSKYDELIGAVGTYFNQSGIDYSFDVFVNGDKVLTQSGVSEFAGFRTIVLDKYVSIKAGDKFKVVFKSNAVPYQAFSRVHYMEGMSLASNGGSSWSDLAPLNKTVCLKVYTLADDSRIIDNSDIAVDYAGGKYFSVKVTTEDGHAVAGASVKFTINGKTTTVKTNGNGMAKIKITDVPKKYTMKTTYNGKSVKNTVTVKQVLKATKGTVKKSAKKFTLKATLKINGKLQKGKKITFKFNGKKYTVKTNAKGIAQKTLKKNVIKKLRKGKTYTVKVTYLKDTIKTSVKVKG